MAQLIATKLAMTQVWTKSGKRIPVTVLRAERNVLLQEKGNGTYVVGYGERRLKNTKKPIAGLLKKANVEKGVRKIQEIQAGTENQILGSVIKPSEIFHAGDIVDVTGISKGTGHTGVVKLHGFKGGPKTHGQSDRLRAPGSIGAGTTPGRVYKNKRMAGRGGGETVTVENLQIITVDDEKNEILVKGLIPGSVNGFVLLTKMGEDKKFEGLFVRETAKQTPATVTEPEVLAEQLAEAAEVTQEEKQA